MSALLLLSACGGPAPTAAADAPSAPAVPTAAVVIQAEELARVSEIGRLGRGKLEDLAYSPDGKTLAAASSVAVVRELRGPLGGYYGVAWLPGGRLVVSACGDGTLRLWSAR